MHIKKYCLVYIFIILFSPSVLAFKKATDADFNAPYHLQSEQWLIKLDYQVVPIPGYSTIDLLGLHYLYRVTHWFYFGFGNYAPMFYGNYGGFFTMDFIAQLQYPLTNHLFLDAGGSFGGGGGGTSAVASKKMCGDGRFVNPYAGVGYHLHHFSFGVNYSYFHFINSPINNAQVDFYIQKSLSWVSGAYRYIDKLIESPLQIDCGKQCNGTSTTAIHFELNNFYSKWKTIRLMSLEFAHYLTQHNFLFLEAEVGYAGIPLYNQLVGGAGYHFLISPRVGFSGQLGIGSGGFDPHRINTGTGLLIYPKFFLEYYLNQKLSLSLTSGYLFAPNGTFQAYSLGLSLNYRLFTGGDMIHQIDAEHPWIFKGFRVNLFGQTEFDVTHNDKHISNLNMLSIQLDSFVHTHWFFPVQVSFAYNDIYGYPGYGEALAGFGLQTKYSPEKRLQYFFAALMGTDGGFIVKPEIGANYSLSDHFAIYAMLGKTISFSKQHQVDSNSVGVGLTYRFSLPDQR